MISETAIETLEEMKAAGLQPSYADIIRLNVLGLRLEAARKKYIVDSTYNLPRVAAVSDKLSFRQPTIGHEIWLEKIERFIDKGDFNTLLAVKAYALSRPQGELADPDSLSTLRRAVEAFCESCKDLSRDQIYAAIEYVIFGSDQGVGVHAAHRPDPGDDDDDFADYDSCVSLGVLNEGRAVLWGITAADMRSMTRRELEDVIRRAYVFHGVKGNDGEIDRLEGSFYATVDEIVERLTKEKNHG